MAGTSGQPTAAKLALLTLTRVGCCGCYAVLTGNVNHSAGSLGGGANRLINFVAYRFLKLLSLLVAYFSEFHGFDVANC